MSQCSREQALAIAQRMANNLKSEKPAEPAKETFKVVFIGGYEGGEVFRSGCCYKREYGNVFYFQPGHESLPTYHNKDIFTV